MTTMFDAEDLRKRIGEEKFTDSLDVLKPVEEFFLDTIKHFPFVHAHDCSAIEPFKFWTMNYTSCAGFFYMHPLQHEITQYQVREAIMDNEEDGIDYVLYFKDKLLSGSANKYTERKPHKGKYSSLVVLTGENKLEDEICLNKLRSIVEDQGKLALIKPHPLTKQTVIDALRKELLPSANIATQNDDLYEIMQNSDMVYTNHSSESAIYATALGKPIKTVSTWKGRMRGTFLNINEVLFSTPRPQMALNKVFSSRYSGLVHPEVHEDWQDRIVQYLEYTNGIRSMLGDEYK
tara:strand:- start:250 stop:1122 length:873 start_codon:yes stop_codon:yes gene_type:complete